MLNDTPRLQMMASKLFELVSDGTISNEWEEKFICDFNFRIYKGFPVSLKQIAKIEELFERY